MTFIYFIGVDFRFGLLDCVCYNKDFVILRLIISRFCSIHFTLTLARLKNIIHHAENFLFRGLLNRGLIVYETSIFLLP